MILLNKKYAYIDVLRVISMFFVIGLHTVADNLRIKYFTANWHFANIVSSFMTVAVPVFFMISGAMILSSEKTDDIGYILKKRLPRLVIPFLIWSLTAIGYYFIKEFFYDPEGIHYYDRVLWRLEHITTTPVTVHLWFVYALIPLYALSPFIRKLILNADKKLVEYFFWIWFLFSGVFPTLAAISPFLKNICAQHYSFNLNLLSGYLGYFVLGYYLHNLEKSFKTKNLVLIFLGGVAATALLTVLYTDLGKGYFEGFKAYGGIITMITSASLFLIIKNVYAGKKESEAVKFFSAISYPVYLMHNLVISFMNINEWIEPSDIFMTVLRFLSVAAVSVALSVLLGSTKLTSYIFTGNRYSDASRSFNSRYIFSKKIKDGEQ